MKVCRQIVVSGIKSALTASGTAEIPSLLKGNQYPARTHAGTHTYTESTGSSLI